MKSNMLLVLLLAISDAFCESRRGKFDYRIRQPHESLPTANVTDFYNEKNKRIYVAMGWLNAHRRSKQCLYDVITVIGQSGVNFNRTYLSEEDRLVTLELTGDYYSRIINGRTIENQALLVKDPKKMPRLPNAVGQKEDIDASEMVLGAEFCLAIQADGECAVFYVSVNEQNTGGQVYDWCEIRSKEPGDHVQECTAVFSDCRDKTTLIRPQHSLQTTLCEETHWARPGFKTPSN